MVEPGTRLSGIVKRPELTVRNGHHQAVDDVAPQLRVSGVQWHPEDSEGPADARLALFQGLITAAAALDGVGRPVS